MKNTIQTINTEIKQVIILRTDLRMGKGKMIAQAAHASLMSYLECQKHDKEQAEIWLLTGEKKIVLKVSSEAELISLYKSAKREGMPSAIIADAGLTQLEPGTKTALAIGPFNSEALDQLTGNLKLL
jgi:PTH2 family peptidyl-tRNA hydrolase